VKCFVVTRVTGATKKLCEKVFGNNTRQAFNRLFAKKKNYTGNFACEKESAANCQLEPLVEGNNCQREKISEIRGAIIIIIVIIIIIIISFMQGIYSYIPGTNYVPREYSVAAILLLLFMMLISLVSVLNILYFYISTFRSMCAVPNMAVFCSSLTSCFPAI